MHHPTNGNFFASSLLVDQFRSTNDTSKSQRESVRCLILRQICAIKNIASIIGLARYFTGIGVLPSTIPFISYFIPGGRLVLFYDTALE